MESCGGDKSGSGRGAPDTHVCAKKGGELDGKASAGRPAAQRSASARKAAASRKRNAEQRAGGRAAVTRGRSQMLTQDVAEAALELFETMQCFVEITPKYRPPPAFRVSTLRYLAIIHTE